MKNISLLIMMLVMIFVSGCSKEDMETNNRDVSIQYNGNSVENRNAKVYTNFYFMVKSKVSTPMEGYVEATTINNEKLKSDRFSLNVWESKEVSIKKEGIVLNKEYIKSYKVYTRPVNVNTFPKPIKAGDNFFNQAGISFPIKWSEK